MLRCRATPRTDRDLARWCHRIKGVLSGRIGPVSSTLALLILKWPEPALKPAGAGRMHRVPPAERRCAYRGQSFEPWPRGVC